MGASTAQAPPSGGRGPRRAAAALAATLAIAFPSAALSQGGAAAAPQQAAPGPAAPAQHAPPAGPGAGAATGPAPGATTAAGTPKLNARSWILVDPRDGAVLASKAPDSPRPIASATKLMTALIALERLKPGQQLTAPPYKALAAESLLGLSAGERMTVRDLLYGLILESGNDAAATIATGVSGSIPKFVQRMNREAERLGLANTSFANPIGLDHPQNYSSASDLVELTEALFEYPLFERISDTATTTLRSGATPRRVTTRNTLLNSDPSADGVKTGHTIGAGYVLVGSATRDGTRLISAVLGAPSEAARDAETERLLDYGFSLYSPSRPVTAGEELADPGLDFRGGTLPLIARRGVELSVRDGQVVETEVDAPEEVSGAVEEGEALGKVTVRVDGEVAASAPLVAATSVEAASLFDKLTATVQNPLILIALGLFVIVIGVLVARGRRPHHGDDRPVAGPPPPRERRPRNGRRPASNGERTPEERRKMHEERMRRRAERKGGGG